MQTFLPHSDFKRSAGCLDNRRLGKQRSETKQILMILRGETQHWKRPDAWKNHPAVVMWHGYKYALALYGVMICREWIQRGFKDETMSFFTKRIPVFEIPMPYWLGDTEIHASHRPQLLGKNFDWYSQFNWMEKPGAIPYFWPKGREN